ncbi:MAG TPA: hypothetical protein V6C71_08175 [Coleofasciculaceae cyanobacterium]
MYPTDRIFLDPQGIIKLFAKLIRDRQSADFYKTIDNADLRVWSICRAIYQLPTIELVEWLKTNFNLDKTIEIGAGNNYLYHHFGIKGIDNYCEQILAVKQVHEILNQPSTNPPSEVENLEEIAAIKKYQPETVIAAWITLKTEDPEGVDAGHGYAPDEEKILDTGVTYIHIANKY